MNAQLKPDVKRISTTYDKNTFIIQKRKKDCGYAVIGLNRQECKELIAELIEFSVKAN